MSPALGRRAPPEASAPLFAALGDATRLKLVIRLSDARPQSITYLTAGSALTRQANTLHLRILANAGLVRGRRQGRESQWEIEPGRLEVASRYLEMISQRWDERLSALEEHLATTGPKPGRSRRG
jgi:DNA-binding transcriptional ArsR family regulator